MKLASILAAAALTTVSTVAVAASPDTPDTYVVNFRSDATTTLDANIASAVSMAGVDAEIVDIDISNAAKWEASAHRAFDRDIVSVFNKWVGLPGFAAIVDARTKRVVGCVNDRFSAAEIAQEVRRHTLMAAGRAVKTDASAKTTECPATYNK